VKPSGSNVNAESIPKGKLNVPQKNLSPSQLLVTFFGAQKNVECQQFADWS
jgi:hypothetical protein